MGTAFARDETYAVPPISFNCPRAIQLLAERDEVCWRAVSMQVDHRSEDVPVRVAVEVFGPQEIGDLRDGLRVEDNAPQHPFLGLDVLGKQTLHQWAPFLCW